MGWVGVVQLQVAPDQVAPDGESPPTLLLANDGDRTAGAGGDRLGRV